MSIRLLLCALVMGVLVSTTLAQTAEPITAPPAESSAPETIEPGVASDQGDTDSDVTPGSIIARDLIIDQPDTYPAIARRLFNTAGLARHLAEFNNQSVDTVLSVGDIVRIPLYVPARAEAARVAFVKGTVLRGGEPLQLDDEVFLDDRIEADEQGFVSLVFASGTVVNLQPGTVAELVRLNCLVNDDSCLIEIVTEGGELDADVQSRDDQASDFRISTPYASAAVRGTEFNFDAADAEVLVGVTDGDIAVSALDQTVGLQAGFGLVTREGEPPGAPVALLPAPAFRFVPARATAEDRIVWFPISDSPTFNARLSTDIEGNAVIARIDGQGTTLTLDDVDGGDYYLQLRGVDAAGFKGFATTTRLTVADIDASLAAPATALSRQGSELLVEVTDTVDEAAGYEIQIATDSDFLAPISVDVGTNGSAVFRLDSDEAFARARVLVDPLTVSRFGAISEVR